MTTTYHPSAFQRFGNRMLTRGLNRGRGRKGLYLLTVTGRRTGQPHTTPIALVEDAGQRWLVSPYGQTNWVRNVRAAGQVTIRRGEDTDTLDAIELGAEQAAPVLRQYLAEHRITVGRHFHAKPDAPLPEFAAEADRHPVFELVGHGTREP